MHFGSNNYEFGWLFVLVGMTFCKEQKKIWRKVFLVLIYVKPNLVLSHFQWLWFGGFPGSPKNFWVLTYVKPNLVLSDFQWLWWGWWGEGVHSQKVKVAQNSLKHTLISEFLRSDEIFWNSAFELPSKQANKQPYNHCTPQWPDKSRRSAGGATKKITWHNEVHT